MGAVDAAFGRLRTKWIAMRAESCAATRLRHDQSEALLDLRTACLDSERRRAGAMLDVFLKADRATVESASTAAAAETVTRRSP